MRRAFCLSVSNINVNVKSFGKLVKMPNWCLTYKPGYDIILVAEENAPTLEKGGPRT
jgi:hypothetical protein